MIDMKGEIFYFIAGAFFASMFILIGYTHLEYINAEKFNLFLVMLSGFGIGIMAVQLQ